MSNETRHLFSLTNKSVEISLIIAMTQVGTFHDLNGCLFTSSEILLTCIPQAMNHQRSVATRYQQTTNIKIYTTHMLHNSKT